MPRAAAAAVQTGQQLTQRHQPHPPGIVPHLPISSARHLDMGRRFRSGNSDRRPCLQTKASAPMPLSPSKGSSNSNSRSPGVSRSFKVSTQWPMNSVGRPVWHGRRRETTATLSRRSGGCVDDVEAVKSHEDAIAATTSSSSSFSAPSQCPGRRRLALPDTRRSL